MEENSFNNTITIEGDQITPEHIQKCKDAFKDILNDHNINPELIIEAKGAIKEVDFSIFGHFMLFSSEYSRKYKRKIDIKLILKNNYPEPNDEDENSDPASRSITWKIRQHLVHAYYSMGMKSVFSMVDGNGEFSEAETNKNGWFVLSKKFLPITYLNNSNYENLFKTKLQSFELNDINGKGKDENTFYQSIRRHLFKKKTSNNYLSVLSQLAFYRCLQQAKLLRYYLYDKLDETARKKLKFLDNKDNFQVSYVQDETTKEKYREIALDIFGELESKPPIYHLVFFSLISKFDDTITKNCIN
ncbi:MAG: hypothetical protein Q8T08_06555, partial [Ignavibacteria bacterium]|nr:hypothetical protein [Ignavibacteria bacterium]